MFIIYNENFSDYGLLEEVANTVDSCSREQKNKKEYQIVNDLPKVSWCTFNGTRFFNYQFTVPCLPESGSPQKRHEAVVYANSLFKKETEQELLQHKI